MAQEIKVPDIGDFDAVEIIEVLVAEGDTVEKEQPLITLESDKATLEVPSTVAGKITELKVAEGDTVSEGDVIAMVEAADEAEASEAKDAEDDKPAPKADDAKDNDKAKAEDQSSDKSDAPRGADRPAANNDKSDVEAKATTPANDDHDYDCDVLVLGSGPGGYTAAFRAADMGLNVTLVERHNVLGGVCLNVGCIPSKALLHSAKVIEDAANMASHGVTFGKPEIDLAKLLDYKQSVIDQLTGGLKSMASKRQVNVVTGTGTFKDEHTLSIEGDSHGDGETSEISFNNCIIAVGSEPVILPDWPEDDRIWDSEAALSPDEIPKSLLVIGGGIIGLELANVYAAHGTDVDIVEMTDTLIPGADRDLVKPLQKRMSGRCGNIWTGTKVTGIKAGKKSLKASFEGKDAPESKDYDRVLAAIGRKPNGKKIGAENVGAKTAPLPVLVRAARAPSQFHDYAVQPHPGRSHGRRQLIMFLVDHHLTLWRFATKRNIDDPDVVAEFAGLMKNRHYLDALLLFTYADSNGTSEEAWNPWKETLLVQLWRSARVVLKKGYEAYDSEFRGKLENLREKVRSELHERYADLTDGHFQQMPKRYFRYRDALSVGTHIRAIWEYFDRRKRRPNTPFEAALQWINYPDQGYSELTVVTHDRHMLLEKICCSLAAHEINILSADIYTRSDGVVLDIFRVSTSEMQSVSNTFQQMSVVMTLYEVNQEEEYDPSRYLEAKSNFLRDTNDDAIPFPVRAYVDNESDPNFTVIEIQAIDRIGLLHDLLYTINKHGLNTIHARITTEKGAALDTFYVQTANEGGHLDRIGLLAALQEALEEVLLVPAREP